jgi:hypothetical protein
MAPKPACLINHCYRTICVPITGQNAQHINTSAQHRPNDYCALTNEQTWSTIGSKRIAVAYLLIWGKVWIVDVRDVMYSHDGFLNYANRWG